MSDQSLQQSPINQESGESFADILSQYEQSHARVPENGRQQIQATVIAVNADTVFLDIGFKSEGTLPLAAFQAAGETVKPGDKFPVSIKGRDTEGYYQLSRGKIHQPKDWSAFEQAFNDKATIIGTVSGVVKGGFSVDVGIRAFMPASRSGVRDAAGMEKLVGQEIHCRIIKLDVADEDVVVDRRVVMEEEERVVRDRRSSEIQEGDTLSGTVRSLTDYGAFIDLGGVDALLHVGEIAWARVNKPADVLSVGQPVEVKVLKISDDPGKRRISVGMKQLQPNPWDAAVNKYIPGERVRGPITRVLEFGAFVELEPGVEGLIHVSEMSWSKKMRKADTIVKPGEMVEAVVLGVSPAERRISLGLKQALGDPWAEIAGKLMPGSVVEGPVTSIMKFGAFVQLAEGVEGMIHISEIVADKRLNHPQEAVRVGQIVKAQVIAIDPEKRQMKLSMKQLLPTGLDDYLAERKEGDLVSGRVIEMLNGRGRVQLGEGVQGTWQMPADKAEPAPANEASGAANLSALSSMLKAHWKGAGPATSSKREFAQSGQVRKFRIVKLDAASKQIELELAQ